MTTTTTSTTTIRYLTVLTPRTWGMPADHSRPAWPLCPAESAFPTSSVSSLGTSWDRTLSPAGLHWCLVWRVSCSSLTTPARILGRSCLSSGERIKGKRCPQTCLQKEWEISKLWRIQLLKYETQSSPLFFVSDSCPGPLPGQGQGGEVCGEWWTGSEWPRKTFWFSCKTWHGEKWPGPRQQTSKQVYSKLYKDTNHRRTFSFLYIVNLLFRFFTERRGQFLVC